MSESTSSSEPATGPTMATAETPAKEPHTAPPGYVEPRRRGRLGTVAAWVGIVAGVVFIVAVVFFSGFVLGAHSGGGHHGWHHRDHNFAIMHKGPGMFPMGPRGDLGRSGPGMQPPSGPGGPNAGPQQPASPTPATPRP